MIFWFIFLNYSFNLYLLGSICCPHFKLNCSCLKMFFLNFWPNVKCNKICTNIRICCMIFDRTFSRDLEPDKLRKKIQDLAIAWKPCMCRQLKPLWVITNIRRQLKENHQLDPSACKLIRNWDTKKKYFELHKILILVNFLLNVIFDTTIKHHWYI